MHDSFRIGEWLVEPQTNTLTNGYKATHIEPKIMQVLVCLAEHAGEVVPKERLIREVWTDTFVTDDVVTHSISELRKIFGDPPKDSHFIQTIPRNGYRLIAPVSSDGIKQESELETAPPPTKSAPVMQMHRQRRSQRWWAILIGIGVIMIGALLLWLRAPVPPPKVLGAASITNNGRQKAWDYAPSGFFTLATDGSRIFFSELTGNPWSIVQVPAAGGETVSIQTPFQKAMLFDVSPDGSKLLVGSWSTLETEVPIWVVPATGGPPYRLGNLLAHDAAWSPDGRMIVYGNGSDLSLAQADGTQPRKLVAVGGRPSWIRWSPDGQRLRFTVQDASNYSSSLWEVAADGTNLHRLFVDWNEPSSECCGNWTADGKYYVFQSSLESTTNIWATREKTGLLEKADPEPVRLTTGPMNFSRPVPSKDGRKLFVIGELQRGELVRFDVKSRQFVSYLSGISAEHVDYSKDGNWVAYVSHPEGTLWRSKADGSNRLQLSLPPMITALPRWSPDGKHIAFMARAPGRPWKINRVSPDGGAAEQLIAGGLDLEEGDPTWSPDGNRLAFGSNLFAEEVTSATKEIHLLDTKTGRSSKLSGSDGMFAPRWSPDGRHIVAQSGDMKELLLFDFITSRWTVLTRAAVMDAVIIGWQHWSRDAKYIYFSSWGYDPAVFRIRVSDNKLERVATLKDLRILIGVFGGWIGFAPDDSPVVLRHTGSQEIYALEWIAP